MLIAFLYPGQGSQQVGMGKEFAEKFDTVASVFKLADEVLGIDLATLCFSGPLTRLTHTINAQPAIVTVDYAISLLYLENGVDPCYVSGHSVGTFAALVTAGVIGFADAILVVRERGRLMNQVQAPGLMAGVTVANEARLADVAAVLEEESVEIGCYNSQSQIIISGEDKRIRRVMDRLRDWRGTQIVLLNVGHAFHSRLMEEAKSAFQQYLTSVSFENARIPVVLNSTGASETNALKIQKDLVEQFTSPVRWGLGVEFMVEQGVETFVETGVSRRLQGLNRAFNTRAKTLGTESVAHFRANLKQLLAGGGSLD